MSCVRYFAGAALLSLFGCVSSAEPQGFLRFAYSIWRVNPNGAPVDLGCVEAGVERIHIDLFSEGLAVGAGEVVCDAFGNGDGLSSLEELGEFTSGFPAVTFDQLRVTLIGAEDALLTFGLRLDGTDSAAGPQQDIAFQNPVTINTGAEINLQFSGEPGIQLASELQVLLP